MTTRPAAMTTRKTRIVATAVLVGATIATLGAGSGQSASARTRPTTTTTTTTTTTVPPTTTIVPTSVPIPTSFVVVENFPDYVQLTISPATQLGDAVLLSGATQGGVRDVFVADGGRLRFGQLIENTTYSFRYRNKIWIGGSSFLFSPWVTFSFRSPTGNSLRPASPQNLRVLSRTATSVTLGWDAVATAARYDYSVNGGPTIQAGQVTCVYCEPSNPLAATIQRPGPGTTVSFAVTASRAPTFVNCAYCFPDTRFDTSLPSIITVTN